jgi:hypothetical protein
MPFEGVSPQPPPARSAKTQGRTTTPVTTPKAKKTPPAPSGRIAERKEAVNGLLGLAAFGCLVTGNAADAGALGKHGDTVAGEIAKLAEGNSRIGEGLDKLLEAGPYAGLIAAILPLGFQLMANHGVVKAEYLSGAGVVDPATLAAEVKASQAKTQMEAVRAQNQANTELREMQAERDMMNADVPHTQSFPNPPTSNGQGTMGAQTS